MLLILQILVASVLSGFLLTLWEAPVVRGSALASGAGEKLAVRISAPLIILAATALSGFFPETSISLSRSFAGSGHSFIQLGFATALLARICTLVFVTKYRVYGQIYRFLPSNRRIEISLSEIKDIEIRATIGTKVFRYAHLILYPYNGKKIFLRNIRNAEELALIILKLQEKLQRSQPETKA